MLDQLWILNVASYVLTHRPLIELIVAIANIFESMNLLLLGEEKHALCVHRRVAPSLIKHATGTIQVVEKASVLRAPKDRKCSDLEVRPHRAHAYFFHGITSTCSEEIYGVARCQIAGSIRVLEPMHHGRP